MRNNRCDVCGEGSVLLMLIAALFLMPVVGLGLMCSDDTGGKVVGTVFFFVGTAIWVSAMSGN